MVATDRNLDLARQLMRAPDASEWVDEVDALLRPPAWHLEANCRGVDQRLFFPEKGEPLGPALIVRPTRVPRLSAWAAVPDLSPRRVMHDASRRGKVQAHSPAVLRTTVGTVGESERHPRTPPEPLTL